VGALGVPDVDDQPTGFVAGVLHQSEAIVHGLDVRPGKELETDACAHRVCISG
jgi:hypothetical protein